MSPNRHEYHHRGWFLAGYAGIAGFPLIEALVRERGSASSLQARRDNLSSTPAIWDRCSPGWVSHLNREVCPWSVRLAAYFLFTCAVYMRRIAAEETLLSRDLPGYGDYTSRTKRLVPYLW